MKRCALLVCLLLAFAGCQQAPQENSAPANQNTQQQEAAKKLFAQAVMLLHNQDVKGSVESLEAAIKIDPTDPNAYLLLSEILIKAQQYDRAVEFLDGTAKAFPNNGSVFYMLSLANKFSGKILPAVLSARRSFEIFKAEGNTEMGKTTAILLEELIKTAQDQEANKGKVPAVATGAVKAQAKEKK